MAFGNRASSTNREGPMQGRRDIRSAAGRLPRRRHPLGPFTRSGRRTSRNGESDLKEEGHSRQKPKYIMVYFGVPLDAKILSRAASGTPPLGTTPEIPRSFFKCLRSVSSGSLHSRSAILTTDPAHCRPSMKDPFDTQSVESGGIGRLLSVATAAALWAGARCA